MFDFNKVQSSIVAAISAFAVSAMFIGATLGPDVATTVSMLA